MAENLVTRHTVTINPDALSSARALYGFAITPALSQVIDPNMFNVFRNGNAYDNSQQTDIHPTHSDDTATYGRIVSIEINHAIARNRETPDVPTGIQKSFQVGLDPLMRTVVDVSFQPLRSGNGAEM